MSEGHVAPQNLTELGEMLRAADVGRRPVLIQGGDSKRGLGEPPSAELGEDEPLRLGTRALRGVVSYEPRDLTVTVRSGTTLEELRSVLAENGQHLPLDPPWWEGATVGGTLATNAAGARRLRYGGWRTRVMGMRIVQANGVLTRSGGQVVKNVAGLSLHKLHIGAFGTLGVIAEVSLRITPKAPRCILLRAHFESCQAALEAGLFLARSRLLPSAVEVVQLEGSGGEAGLRRDAWLHVLLEGQEVEVRAVSREAASACRSAGADCMLGDLAEDLAEVRKDVVEFPSRERLAVEVRVRPAQLPPAWDHAGAAGASRVTADCGQGVLRCSWSGTREDDSDAEGPLSLRRHVEELLGGSMHVLAAPPRVRRHLRAWGTPPAGHALMVRLKETLDTNHTLNPGRYFPGL